MNDLVLAVNNVQDTFADLKMNVKVNLPQIAVIGSQSSGKSSVLENIVGKDFLPRGSGIVTRCPLVLQLVQLPNAPDAEWGEFLHQPGVRHTDAANIREEIVRRTNEICGAAGISDTAIHLKFFSHNTLTLTLVDLPGLVMNAVGDQPKDIDRQIKDMVTKYVSPANTIILAVTPANADLATSASLRLAKQVDPEGVRTLGVLTKLDLMDRGTDAMSMLTGRLIQLRRGFIGVVNRSQQDINEEKDIAAARADERKFFESHASYGKLADRLGTEYLTRTLSHMLAEHIRAVLPELKAHVDRLIASTRTQMEKLGMLDVKPVTGAPLLLSLLQQFCNVLRASISGGDHTAASKELMGGARLDYIFHESFATYVTSLRAKKDLTDDHIRISVRNTAGMTSSLFPSDHVFAALCREQVKKLEAPSLMCAEHVNNELKRIVESCATVLERYPHLKARVSAVCLSRLDANGAPTRTCIRNMILAEELYVDARHPQMQELLHRVQITFYGARVASAAGAPPNASLLAGAVDGDAAPRAMCDIPSQLVLGAPLSENEIAQHAMIREMVEGYFAIVQRTVADQVPKSINLNMIVALLGEIYNQLVVELYSDANVELLLQEAPDITAQRKRVAELMVCYQQAHAALATVQDFAPPPSASISG